MQGALNTSLDAAQLQVDSALAYIPETIRAAVVAAGFPALPCLPVKGDVGAHFGSDFSDAVLESFTSW